MARRISARARLARAPLSARVIENVLRRTLPRRNRFGPINYEELLDEAVRFGIRTRGEFRRLMLRHRRAIIEIDREPLDALHQHIYRSEMGNHAFYDLIRRQRWFSWEAMTRHALELEFGEAYRRFATIRDRPPAEEE